MTEIFCVYKTDSHHSYSSRDLIGLATTLPNAITICKLQAKKEHETIDSVQLFNLKAYKQTQGYSGEGEFDIESNQVDTLL